MWRSNAINHIHTRISYCEGSVSTGMDSYAPVTKTATSMVDSKREFELLAWGRKICSNQLSRNTCMMLARRSEVFEMLVSNNSSYNSPYLFGNFVGGLYQCPGSSIDDGIECNKTNARPIAPLIADVVKYEWVEIIGTGRFKVIRKLILSTYDFGASFGKGPIARLYKIMYQSKRPPLNWPDLIDNRDFQTLNYDYYDDVWNQGTEL